MKFKNLAVILIILIILTGGVYFIWLKNNDIGEDSNGNRNLDRVTRDDNNETGSNITDGNKSNNNNQQNENDNTSENGSDEDKNNISFDATKYDSPNGNFEFSYPKEWYLTEAIADPSENAGVFGDIQSAWNVSSFDPEATPDRGGIPEGSIKIDFEVSIPKEGLELEYIAECEKEENECSKKVINGTEYTRVLNERGQRPSVLYVVMTNSMMYRASAIFGADMGTDQLNQDIKLFDKIATTFKVK